MYLHESEWFQSEGTGIHYLTLTVNPRNIHVAVHEREIFQYTAKWREHRKILRSLHFAAIVNYETIDCAQWT